MKSFKQKKETETENRTNEFYRLVTFLSFPCFTEALAKLNERNPIAYKDIVFCINDDDPNHNFYTIRDLKDHFEDFEFLGLDTAVGLKTTGVGLNTTGVLEIVRCDVSEDNLEEWKNEKYEDD